MSLAESTELAEVTVFTNPETWTWRDLTLPYDAVSGVYVPGSHLDRPVGDSGPDLRAEQIQLPGYMADALVDVVEQLQAGASINCHIFAHVLTRTPSYESASPATIMTLPEVEAVPVGASGAVAVKNSRRHYVSHSIGYGLGERSLQVLSRHGELAIADDREVLDFYRKLKFASEVSLHSYWS